MVGKTNVIPLSGYSKSIKICIALILIIYTLAMTLSTSLRSILPYLVDLLAFDSAMTFGKEGVDACCHVLLLL